MPKGSDVRNTLRCNLRRMVKVCFASATATGLLEKVVMHVVLST